MFSKPLANIGWLYYRAYYNQENKDVKKYNDDLLNIKLSDYKLAINQLNENLKSASLESCNFTLKTIGRGFLTGVGIQHEMNSDNAFKMGMSFDHTSGLPFISGSSIKGACRAVFADPAYLSALMKLETVNITLAPGKSQADLQKFLFEEKSKGLPCIFLGACLSPLSDLPDEQAYSEKKIFRGDVITPHNSPVKKPTPLPFMTVNRGLRFSFYFRIDPQQSNSFFVGGDGNEKIKKLLIAILKYEGLGAKKSYDFGRFEEI